MNLKKFRVLAGLYVNGVATIFALPSIATAQTTDANMKAFNGYVKNLETAAAKGDSDAARSLASTKKASVQQKQEIGKILSSGIIEDELFGHVDHPEVATKVSVNSSKFGERSFNGWSYAKEACVSAGFTTFDHFDAMKICTGADYRTVNGRVQEVRNARSYTAHNYNPIIKMSLVNVHGYAEGNLATVIANYEAQRFVKPLGWSKSVTHRVQFRGSSDTVVSNTQWSG